MASMSMRAKNDLVSYANVPDPAVCFVFAVLPNINDCGATGRYRITFHRLVTPVATPVFALTGLLYVG